MNQMTLEELYEVGCSFEASVGQGTKSERARIPKNPLELILMKS